MFPMIKFDQSIVPPLKIHLSSNNLDCQMDYNHKYYHALILNTRNQIYFD